MSKFHLEEPVDKTSNVSKGCPYCDNRVQSGYLIKHILLQHTKELFAKTTEGIINRRRIHDESLYRIPFVFKFPSQENKLFCCLHCQVGVKKEAFAEKHSHAKECRDGHKAKIIELRVQFPADFTDIVEGVEPVAEEESISLPIQKAPAVKAKTVLPSANKDAFKKLFKRVCFNLAESERLVSQADKRIDWLVENEFITKEEAMNIPNSDEQEDDSYAEGFLKANERLLKECGLEWLRKADLLD
jgi:hypothetical protein